MITRFQFAAAMVFLVFLAALGPTRASAEQIKSIPEPPARHRGEGPFERLILRGVTVINGTGAPARGPMDIVIAGSRIERIVNLGSPGHSIDSKKRPQKHPGDHEMDLSGMYLLPGFIDMHAHIGGVPQGVPAEYVYKLWMGHGVTTIREPGSGNGIDWVLKQQRESAKNSITAPRIFPYVVFGQGNDKPFTTPKQAIAWIRKMAKKGVSGFKFFGARPDILKAALGEIRKLGLRSAMHHAQMDVTRANVVNTADWGLTTMEHWYGLPEALFTDRTVQHYPDTYNYNNEQDRFGEAGRLWAQAAPPGSKRWNEVREHLIGLDFTLDPTFTIYQAARDVMAQRRAEWHDQYTLPSLWKFFTPSRNAHGSFWYDWTTADEVAWKNNYRLWMAFVNDYKNHGGRVTTGSDSGFIYKVYGFGYIQELELLQEAGFHPLEVVRAATLNGAQALGAADRIGSIEAGKLADLVVVAENPLHNFKVLYGTGAVRLDDQDHMVRVGGIQYTIKDGIVFDAARLRADVRDMVRAAKAQRITPAKMD